MQQNARLPRDIIEFMNAIVSCLLGGSNFPFCSRKHLFERCLEDADIVIDYGFLVCRTVIAHEADECEISGVRVSRVQQSFHKNQL